MNTKKEKFYFRTITMICLCFFVVGMGLTMYMMERSREQNIRYFEESVQSMESSLTNLISSNIETLDGVALTIGEIEVTDLRHLLPVIREINNRNAFYRMGFIHEDGKGDMVDMDGTIHQDIDFSKEAFFQEAMGGKNSISNTLRDVYSDYYLNYYGVPVVMNGEIIGVLAAADRTERLRSVLDTSIYSRGGFANLIDSKGTYVIRSLKSAEITSIDELGAFGPGQLEQIYQEMEAGQKGFLEFEDHGERSWATYLPVGFNDWFLIGIVKEQEVNAAYYSIMGTVALVAAAMIIFTLLLYSMNRMQQKNERRLEKLAYQDSLLEIDNFVKFSMDLKEKLKREPFQKAAFWYGDIDDFKIFNETFGYQAGDQFLKNMAALLQESLRDGEMFCRESADHFVGIRYYHDRGELTDWYFKLAEKLEHYSLFERDSFRLVLSIGFYCADTSEGLLTVNEMYNRAKMAQKSIKQEKSIKYAFYSEEIRKSILRDNELEAHMKGALEKGQFKVFIQPKTALRENNRITGGEALVRWEMPGQGMISPGEFIPLFEKNGFIVPLDRFMFESVCRWLSHYLKEGGRHIRIAVNVSRLGIFQEDFLEFYTTTKQKYHIPDGMLELEFTESLAIEDNVLLGRRARELKERGFICSLDDFGAGYSSLNTLKDLPIDVLKLDMLFFKKGADEQRARIIIANIIHLAKQLKIRVVAEGVEEPGQVEFLKENGCDVIQGFVFERPIPAEDFRALLKKDPTGDWGAGFKKADPQKR